MVKNLMSMFVRTIHVDSCAIAAAALLLAAPPSSAWELEGMTFKTVAQGQPAAAVPQAVARPQFLTSAEAEQMFAHASRAPQREELGFSTWQRWRFAGEFLDHPETLSFTIPKAPAGTEFVLIAVHQIGNGPTLTATTRLTGDGAEFSQRPSVVHVCRMQGAEVLVCRRSSGVGGETAYELYQRQPRASSPGSVGDGVQHPGRVDIPGAKPMPLPGAN